MPNRLEQPARVMWRSSIATSSGLQKTNLRFEFIAKSKNGYEFLGYMTLKYMAPSLLLSIQFAIPCQGRDESGGIVPV